MDEEGLGYCYLGTTVYQPQAIIDLLELPKLTFPVATLTVGWPDEEPPMSDRLPLESFIHEETYNDYMGMDIDKCYTRKDNEAMSEGLIYALKRQGFLPWTVRGF